MTNTKTKRVSTHKPLPCFDNLQNKMAFYKGFAKLQKQVFNQAKLSARPRASLPLAVSNEILSDISYRYNKNRLAKVGMKIVTPLRTKLSKPGSSAIRHQEVIQYNRTVSRKIKNESVVEVSVRFKKDARVVKHRHLPVDHVGILGNFIPSSSTHGLDKLVSKVRNSLSTSMVYREWLDMQKRAAIPQLKEYKKKARDMFDLVQTLKPAPADKFNYVGIEIECMSKLNTSDFEDLIIEKAVMLHKYVRVSTDGSIRTNETHRHPIEFRLMMKDTEVVSVMTRFMKLVKPYIKVNASCGLHVHLDMRNRNYGKSFERLYTTLPLLESMVPNSRRTNTYCRINQEKKEWMTRDGQRYQALNPTSYHKFRTLEVRMHSATTNAQKVINWVQLLSIIVDRKFVGVNGKELNEPSRSVSSLLAFFTKYDIPTALRNYIVQRISKFGKSKTLKIPKELDSMIPNQPTTADTEQDEQDDLRNEASA